MLQSIKQFYGKRLEASDGEIGQVKDFYFGDQDWGVRYLVADTGTWLTGRQVLITPHSLTIDFQMVHVNLTRQQIEKSPSFNSHKPVSRQEEERYYEYYGWPSYWQGDALWGTSGFPILPVTGKPQAAPTRSQFSSARPDTHLRSTQAVTGYAVQASDGALGHICDFRMDTQSWAIRQLAVKIGHRFSGKEIWVGTEAVRQISYDESTIFLSLTRESLEKSASAQEAACALI